MTECMLVYLFSLLLKTQVVCCVFQIEELEELCETSISYVGSHWVNDLDFFLLFMSSVTL